MAAKKKAVRKTRPQEHISRADTKARPRKRVPVSGARDILTILQGKNPAYVYRYVKDSEEAGSRILRFQQGGYEFVRSDEEDLEIGSEQVYKSNNFGSIIAVKEGNGYLYLMKIKKEWYDEDQAAKEKDIAKYEQHMSRERTGTKQEDSMYGEPEIGRTFLP